MTTLGDALEEAQTLLQHSAVTLGAPWDEETLKVEDPKWLTPLQQAEKAIDHAGALLTEVFLTLRLAGQKKDGLDPETRFAADKAAGQLQYPVLVSLGQAADAHRQLTSRQGNFVDQLTLIETHLLNAAARLIQIRSHELPEALLALTLPNLPMPGSLPVEAGPDRIANSATATVDLRLWRALRDIKAGLASQDKSTRERCQALAAAIVELARDPAGQDPRERPEIQQALQGSMHKELLEALIADPLARSGTELQRLAQKCEDLTRGPLGHPRR